MQALTHSPGTIFGNQVRYVVPLFQRPYVWNKTDQWEPLWDDVASVAEAVLEAPAQQLYGAPTVAPHFLGAVVLDQKPGPAGYITTRHVIDGQQRLTTLQLLIDAAQEVIEAHGPAVDASALRSLVCNNVAVAENADEEFKVWPTTRDQAAFRASMRNGEVVPEDLQGSAIARAHRFFSTEIMQWAGVETAPESATQRLTALAQTLAHHLKVVVIDLEPGDNAQVIFETLNHRGSPLLAADLIKNMVFQIAVAQGADLQHLYDTYWSAFDDDFWRTRITQGRMTRPRVDVFLNYWLIMKLAREIATDRIFVEFRDSDLHMNRPITDVLTELAEDARVFAAIESLPPASVPGRFYYRVARALDSAAVTPFLLWVMRARVPEPERDRALDAMESWLVRRAICRLSSKDLNKAVVDLIRQLDGSGASVAGEVTEQFLGQARGSARLWPDDEWVVRMATTQPLYKSLTRPRMRMLLEALEDDARSQKTEPGLCPRNLTVEHVMPQAWRDHWNADDLDGVAALARDHTVQTLGNLTLVSGKLNGGMSNHPWTNTAAAARGLGAKGKRDALLDHSVLKLNAKLVAAHGESWDDASIQARGEHLAQRLITIWPRPASAAANDPGVVRAADRSPEANPIEPDDADEEGAETGTKFAGKYRPLYEWLQAQNADVTEIPVTFDDVELVLGFELPTSGRTWLPYWYGDHSAGKAARVAGWRCSGVTLTGEKLTFVRATGG